MSERDERIHELRQKQDACTMQLTQQITNLADIAVDAVMERDRLHRHLDAMRQENIALRQERDEARQDADRWARLYEACKRYRSGYKVQES